MSLRESWKEELGPFAAGALLFVLLASTWWARLPYPFDLEWMEGGMLAHAWRIDQGLAVYVRPNADFVPYVYPPGYSAVVAALGKVFGLSMPLGRAVSVVSILAAAGAIGWAVARANGPRMLVWAAPVMFLGTYPMSGAFYDLVRPDSLGIALLGWSIVLGSHDRKWAPYASGLLLAAAFVVKQNAAAFGVPMALALLQRDWRQGLQFVVASVVPALVSVAFLEWWSSGHFLTWMLAVPRSHPMAWTRAYYDVPREWGTALPLAVTVVGVSWLMAAIRRQEFVPAWLSSTLIIWSGMFVVWYGMRNPPPPDVSGVPAVYGVGFWAVAAAPMAIAVLVVGVLARALVELRNGSYDKALAQLWPWWFTYDVGVVLVAGTMALLMRVHESGFINVHTPFFWCLSYAAATAMARGINQGETPLLRTVVSAGLTLQMLWGVSQLDRTRLVPTPADEALGWQFVEEVRKVEGRVLSPWAAWLPTYAGKPPSLHAMGLWDCDFPKGPYAQDLAVIDQALESHYWSLILGGNRPMLGEFVRFYDPLKEMVPDNVPTLNPKTGYIIRPWRLLVPKAKATPTAPVETPPPAPPPAETLSAEEPEAAVAR